MRRLHFAVMFSTMDNTIQYEIWNGIVEYARVHDIHLSAYIGTYQTNDYDFASHLETCLEALTKSSFLDGLIFFAGFLAHSIGQEKFEKYIARMPKHIPIVSVSYIMPGVPSVLADNMGGMQGATEHLIKKHAKKKIAFVKGPEGHFEAEQRLQGYKNALAAHGLDYDENYVFPGNFNKEGGRDAVRALMEMQGQKADAIVTSNDETAMGVLNELRIRKIAVPAKIAVASFDDDIESATFSPSISTARQDFFEIGRVSAQTLFNKINQLPQEDIEYVPSAFVARQSCGCSIEVPLPVREWFKEKSFFKEEFLHLFDHFFHNKAIQAKDFVQDDARMLLRRVTSALVLIFDIDSLAEELYKLLPDISLHSALLGLYRRPIRGDEAGADRTIETLIGFDGEQKIKMKHSKSNPISLYDYKTIDNFDFEARRRTLFFIPLFFKDEEVGVMLLPFAPSIPVDAYETLRINISTAVKGAELLSKIQTLSITDELTGLLNRRGFFQFVYSRMQHLLRNPELIPLVMFMDMDGLKLINDTYGHSEGDRAIAAFATVVKESLREEDIIGRMGGDEFIVFSSVNSRETGEQVVARIRKRLQDYNTQSPHPYTITASIGSVILDAATKDCFEAAMLRADTVLYEEKSKKRKLGLSRQ